MMSPKLWIILMLLALILLASIAPSKSEAAQSTPTATASSEERRNFAQYFEPSNVIGSFDLYDLNADHYIRYNSARTSEGFIPASTYKIFNSLFALETGVATDENFV